MTKQEFLAQLDGVIGEPAGTLKEETLLSDIGAWDSLANVQYLSLVDEHFGKIVPANKLAEAKTVGDLLRLIQQDWTH